MQEKKKNKNFYYIVGGIAIAFIVVAIALALFWHYRQEDSPENKLLNVSQNEDITPDLVKKTFKNNYLISYLLEGDVGVGEGTVTIGDITYYAVKDDLLTSFNKLNDIKELILNNLRPELASGVLERLHDPFYNQYFESEGHLYVKKREKVCKHPELEEDKIEYQLDTVDNNIIVNMGSKVDRIYINPALENPYVMIFLVFSCEKMPELKMPDSANNQNTNNTVNNTVDNVTE